MGFIANDFLRKGETTLASPTLLAWSSMIYNDSTKLEEKKKK